MPRAPAASVLPLRRVWRIPTTRPRRHCPAGGHAAHSTRRRASPTSSRGRPWRDAPAPRWAPPERSRGSALATRTGWAPARTTPPVRDSPPTAGPVATPPPTRSTAPGRRVLERPLIVDLWWYRASVAHGG